MTHTTLHHAGEIAPELQTPPGTRVFGVWIAIVSIAVAFAAALSAYVIFCYRHEVTGQALPNVFWLSSFVILISSVMIQYALVSARMGHERVCRRATWASAALVGLFLLLQIPGFVQLFNSHRAMIEQQVFIFGILLVLIGLHAAHVLGGLLPLANIALHIKREPVTQHTIETLRVMSLYQHTLTLIWMAMFTAFLLVG